MVDKLCLEHESESRKQHRQLRKLFQLVFGRLKEYRDMAALVIDHGNQVGVLTFVELQKYTDFI